MKQSGATIPVEHARPNGSFQFSEKLVGNWLNLRFFRWLCRPAKIRWQCKAHAFPIDAQQPILTSKSNLSCSGCRENVERPKCSHNRRNAQENESKRNRAVKRAGDERKQREQKEQETIKLKKQCRERQDEETRLRRDLEEHRRYHDFLAQVGG